MARAGMNPKTLQYLMGHSDIGVTMNTYTHIGPFDNEPSTVALMDQYIAENGYANDMNETRLHHEIYLSDARKAAPEKRKTVIRHPIRTQ